MTTCISVSASRCRMLLTVDQCLRNSLTQHGKQLFRELRTYVKPQRSLLPGYIHNRLTCQSRVQLWRTDFAPFKKDAIFYTGCTRFSSHDNKPNVCADDTKPEAKKEEKLSLVQKFKRMYKEYWYVLVPVHIATSIVWFGCFYYLAVSGINIAELMESCGAPESWIENIKNSKAGGVVVAYTLYKIATPIRYTVSLGGTTVAINYLKKWGWIKPVPNREEFKRMYQEQKGAFKDLTSSYHDKLQLKKDDLLKTKKEIQQHYEEARDGLQRSVIESKRDLKMGVKEAAAEWKTLGGLISKNVKECLEKKSKPDYIAKISENPKPKKK